MNIRNTGCCAVNEITQLSTHKTSIAAMKEFCRQLSETRPYLNTLGTMEKPYGFYLFTGVVGDTESKAAVDGIGWEYGPAFAALIRKEHLGAVTASVPRPNRVNHATHIVRVWTWAPDPPALKAWYEGVTAKKKVAAKRAA